MRRFRYETGGQSPPHVVILARISNIYSNLRYEFFVNPWQLYASDHILLSGDCTFEANFDTTFTKGEHPPTAAHSKDNAPTYAKSDACTSRKHITNTSKACSALHSTAPLIVSHTIIATHSDLKATTPRDQLNPSVDFHPFALQVRSTVMAMPKPGRIARYMYEKLREGVIRLLELLPGTDEEPLRGIIFQVPLESAGHYRALSYVWYPEPQSGSPSVPTGIVNGIPNQSERLWTPTGPINITPNLKAALQHLRQKNEALTLWVDSVCIQQHDNKEKALQIRLLPHIFQRATSVFAYLGKDSQSQRAIETLMQIRAKDALKDWPKFLPPVPASWNARATPLPTDPVWNDIRVFFHNQWFRRAWIVQEVVLAASVRIVCGKWIMDWNDLLSATETIDREHRSNDTSSDVLPWEFFLELAQHREWEARQTRWALINLLESFRYLDSTLKRDRLFALLGFASDGANAAFEPDYDAPLEVVVRRFAGAFIKQGKVLQLLYQAGLGSHPSRFPSWIPDWTTPKLSSLYESFPRDKRSCASWISEPQTKHKPESDELEVLGYRMDEVENVTTATNAPEQWHQYFKEIDSMLSLIFAQPFVKSIKYTTDYKDDAGWKVPIAGALYPSMVTSGTTDLHQSYTAFRRELLTANLKQFAGLENQDPGAPLSNFRQGSNYALALQGNLSGRKFFVTRQGLAGIGPGNTAVGHAVCVFNGGGVPFLIESSKERNDVWRLLGECYVHGIMNGEGEGWLSAEEQWIRLH